MLSPKRTKFRKMQKGNNRGIAWRGSDIAFGDFGLQCIEPGRLWRRYVVGNPVFLWRAVRQKFSHWTESAGDLR